MFKKIAALSLAISLYTVPSFAQDNTNTGIDLTPVVPVTLGIIGLTTALLTGLSTDGNNAVTGTQ